ncbi:MAG: RNA 2'-phosphotransferase [Promethearchaeota archaeon]
MNDVQISKFISYVLRHNPKGKVISEDGWMDLKDLLELLNIEFSYTIELDDVMRVVSENDKQRFKINENKIRASQGHTLKKIKIELIPRTPPDILYHGTKKQILKIIKKEGLKKMNRHHVHLSAERKTAEIVARRWHQGILILEIDTRSMHLDGYVFYLSDNGVWLTDKIPPRYIKFM